MVALMMDSHHDLFHDEPDVAARLLIEGTASAEWLDSFMHQLTSLRSSHQLAVVLDVWGLSQAEFAETIGVSRQAIGKWLDRLPADRQVLVATLGAATDLLVHYVRRERIPAVVRRPAPALGNRSLLDMVAGGDIDELLGVTRRMFDPAGAIA